MCLRVGAKTKFDAIVGRRGRCVKHWSRTPADPGSIPGAGDKNKRLIYLPCNIRGCAPRHVARISRTNGDAFYPDIEGGSETTH